MVKVDLLQTTRRWNINMCFTSIRVESLFVIRTCLILLQCLFGQLNLCLLEYPDRVLMV